MNKKFLIQAGLAIPLLLLLGFCAWLLSLPGQSQGEVSPPDKGETDALLASFKPPKRERPLIAVVGINDGTETTDYLMPTGILRRADIADVVMLAPDQRPVELYPALAVDPDDTIAGFDSRNPGGADFVIVPAMRRDDDPLVLAWLKSQAKKGATIVGVCAGARIVAAAGLLDGRRATTHWYYLDGMLKEHPSIRYVPNRRFVIDEHVATTTGISASMPTMVTVIEAIAGPGKASEVARDLGLSHWDARHASASFKLTRPFVLTAMANQLAAVGHDDIKIELRSGMDEVSLALLADAWSRTYRSKAVTFADESSVNFGAAGARVVTRSGLRVTPDHVWSKGVGERSPAISVHERPAKTLDGALSAISARYGRPTARLVAMQLEYPVW